MSILQASHLAKSYHGRRVVDDVSINISAGEAVGLLGPNGAGKTTSFYMIVGLVAADEGKVTLDEHDISTLPMHARAQLGLGYLAQEPSIFRKLSVENNILAVLQARKGLSALQRQQHCDKLLQEFRIDHLRKANAMGLSGGERRRLEIARALSLEPRFILLDEPFAGIDPISVSDIKGLITTLRDKGIGVLITDHNVRETLDICDRGYIINEGHVMAAGTPEQILQNEEVRNVYLGQEFRM
ncbi:MAG: LPS export ABC transporter ATP-binding protein [gamma proteobacterium symbiont of Bathyaustriella thionipta]|nr:LPS export ABC transporter ATP-binding protein [gamma proteobacterium symbiont of Bathyaustriella thionipta]